MTEMMRHSTDGGITQSEAEELAHFPFFFVWKLCSSKKTDILDRSAGSIEDFDAGVRENLEAYVIHAWYAYIVVRRERPLFFSH